MIARGRVHHLWEERCPRSVCLFVFLWFLVFLSYSPFRWTLQCKNSSCWFMLNKNDRCMLIGQLWEFTCCDAYSVMLLHTQIQMVLWRTVVTVYKCHPHQKCSAITAVTAFQYIWQQSWAAAECPHSVSDWEPIPMQVTVVQQPHMVSTTKIFDFQWGSISIMFFFSTHYFLLRVRAQKKMQGYCMTNKQTQRLSSGFCCQNQQPHSYCSSTTSGPLVCVKEGYREWQESGNSTFL